MDKKRFRSRVADRNAARYPTLLTDEGRRSFLRALGGGLLGAALGSLTAGCDDARHPTAGKPDLPPSRFDAWVEPPVDGPVRNDLSGVPDMPPARWETGPDGLPGPDMPVPEMSLKDLQLGDASAEQPASDAGVPDDTRPELGRTP